ncbi:MAG TPA: O-antigen ligase family protein [Fimbriimonadaceae bacterium]|nr:O-antigen ligase family protein [Fimbriimonadaceae bacterium]
MSLPAIKRATKMPSPEELAARVRGSQSTLMERALIGWGVVNIVLILMQMFVSPFGAGVGVNIGNLNKYFMFSLAAWVMVALLRKAAPLRVPGAMVFVVLVQVWFTVSTIVAQLQLGRSREFMSADYVLVTYLLCFVNAAMMVYMEPRLRIWLKRAVVGLCLVSSFFAVLQFLNFGPAIAVANVMVGVGDISNWGGQGGVRAMGLFPGVGTQVTYNLIAIALIASALFQRKLKFVEIAVIVVLTGTILMTQVRNSLPMVALVLLPLIVLFVRRHKVQSIPYVVAGLVALAVLLMVGGDRFNYMFSGDTSTFDYRQDVLWPQARSIYQQRPWFGIGVEPAFTGADTLTRDRWSDGIIMDNGYLVTLAFGGLPALSFMVLAIVAGALGSLRLIVNRSFGAMERGFALVAGVIVLHFGYEMYFGNMFTNVSLAMFYFILAGAALPSKGVADKAKSLLGALRERAAAA